MTPSRQKQKPDKPEKPEKQTGHTDISTAPRPDLGPDAWRDPAATIEVLRDWAEAHTITAIEWYLKDKRSKRIGSRATRALAVIFAGIGGIVPLIADSLDIDVAVGYVFLALAAGCVAFDHFFGFSSGWMRDMSTAQALQQRLMTFRILWVRWQAEQAGVLPVDQAEQAGQAGVLPVKPDSVRSALDMIQALVIDVEKATNEETAAWIGEFKASLSGMDRLSKANGPDNASNQSP
jgi:hypothetical protein